MSSSSTQISPASALPKYKRLSDDIRNQIQSGALRPGDRLPSMAEMHAAHGVTPTTVERIYAVLREEGLIVREQGRGTFVAHPVTRPTTGVLGVAGITFDSQRAPYWSDLMAALHSEAEKLGFDLLLLNEASVIRWERIDGVLLCGSVGWWTHQRLPKGMPSVFVLSQMEGATSVQVDEVQGVNLALDHLLALGHQKIGYFVSQGSEHRLEAYRKRLKDVGIDPLPHWAHASLMEDNVQRAHEEMRAWLSETKGKFDLTALLTQNDESAICAIDVLRESGIRTPEDVSVVGFDGTAISDYFSPRLTSVRLPLREVGTLAVQELVKRLKDQSVQPTTQVLPVSLKVGQSTIALK